MVVEPDPDSDIPVDEQEEFLGLHRLVYEVTQEALHTAEFDADELEFLMAGASLDETIEGLEWQRSEGIVSRSTDTEVAWVEVAEVGERAVVHECRFVGPATGFYDRATGERVEDDDRDGTVAVLYEVTYEATVTESGGGFRATQLVLRGDDRCGDVGPAAPSPLGDSRGHYRRHPGGWAWRGCRRAPTRRRGRGAWVGRWCRGRRCQRRVHGALRHDARTRSRKRGCIAGRRHDRWSALRGRSCSDELRA